MPGDDVFPSRIDTWFLLLFVAGLPLLLLGAALVSARRRSRSAPAARVVAAVLGLLAIAEGAVAYPAIASLRYVVRDNGDVVAANSVLGDGLAFNARDAVAVRPSDDRRGAAASSLERVAIEVRGRDLPVLLSPDDRRGFCAALQRHNAAIYCAPEL